VTINKIVFNKKVRTKPTEEGLRKMRSWVGDSTWVEQHRNRRETIATVIGWVPGSGADLVITRHEANGQFVHGLYWVDELTYWEVV